MPNSPLKPCAYPGCPNLVRSGYCDVHRQQPAAYVRDPERQHLYDRAWQRRRRIQLADHPWCEDCLAKGIYTSATDVHHEQRHEGDRDVFMRSPLKSLCHACHSARTLQEVKGEGAEKVFTRGASSARGLPHEKNSPIEPGN